MGDQEEHGTERGALSHHRASRLLLRDFSLQRNFSKLLLTASSSDPGLVLGESARIVRGEN